MGAEFPPPQSEAQGNFSVEYAEVEKIFALADDIYLRIQKTKKEKNIELLSFLFGVFLGFGLIALIEDVAPYGISETINFVFRIIIVSVFITFVVGGASIILRHSHRSVTLRAESRALRRVIDLLHELEQDLDRQTAWSPVQRAEFRIRLSRYVIDEK